MVLMQTHTATPVSNEPDPWWVSDRAGQFRAFADTDGRTAPLYAQLRGRRRRGSRGPVAARPRTGAAAADRPAAGLGAPPRARRAGCGAGPLVPERRSRSRRRRAARGGRRPVPGVPPVLPRAPRRDRGPGRHPHDPDERGRPLPGAAAGVAAGAPAAPVGRSALLEVGCSAGLNLRIDRYRLGYGDPVRWVGEPDAAVQLHAREFGDHAVPAGAACRRSSTGSASTGRPIDVHDDDAVRWLEACVFPERLDRIERLRRAVDVARARPGAGRRRATASPTWPRSPRRCPLRRAALCVFHSWALTYFPDRDGVRGGGRRLAGGARRVVDLGRAVRRGAGARRAAARPTPHPRDGGQHGRSP